MLAFLGGLPEANCIIFLFIYMVKDIVAAGVNASHIL